MEIKFLIAEGNNVHPFVIGQLHTEATLLEHFISLGGQIIRGFEFKEDNVIESSNQYKKQPYSSFRGPFTVTFTAYKETSSALPFTVVCSHIVGCDGKHSSVRQWLRINFKSYGSSQSGNIIIHSYFFRVGYIVY